MRIAIAQINSILGDFQNNRNKIIEYVRSAQAKNADVVIFPEATLFGYHPFDLLEQSEIVDRQMKEFKKLADKIPQGIGVLVGLMTKNPEIKGRPFLNSVAFLVRDQKPKFFHKQLLPTGDVFDEGRFIESGSLEKNYFSFKGKKFFLTICEDIWAWPNQKGESPYKKNPLTELKTKKVDLVINMSASPFYPGKEKVRKELVSQTAARFKAPMIYVNLVGAQDEIIFDGSSFGLDHKGKEFIRCLSFSEDLNFFDLETLKGGRRIKKLDSSEALRQALVLGLRDFCKKTGLNQVHLGLSGGIDSALVACLAVDTLGPSKVRGFFLPSEFSSGLSQQLANQLAKNLNIPIQEIAIQNIFSGIKAQLDKDLNIAKFGVVHENIQSRIRGMILMAYSNLSGSLLLSTGNKSELATGFCTMYGDTCGGLLPIGDLTKTQVFQLSKLYNSERELIPQMIIDRPPTAELRPNQKDQDSLPPYEVLDASIERTVGSSKTPKSAVDFWLLNILGQTEFKRWQSAPILKVSKRSFGRGRHWPIAGLKK